MFTGTHTQNSCNSLCQQRTWCTTFFIHTIRIECSIYASGCTKFSSNTNFNAYKSVEIIENIPSPKILPFTGQAQTLATGW